ncbi:hypothetical protein BX666DRAFT_2016282, partial [Dichotomocladium elegans]
GDPQTDVHLFWSLPLFLPARDLGYRTILKKLPCLSVLQAAGVVSSATCRLCNHDIDTFEHFTTSCPPRWQIWQEGLAVYFPSFALILKHLCRPKITPPPSLPSSEQSRFFTVCFSIHWAIWTSFFRMIFHDIPFHPSSVSSKAHNIISLSLSSSQLLREAAAFD